MRWVIAALALGLAACSEGASETTDTTNVAESGSGYTMEIRATNEVQTYVVTAPDGRIVGGRAANGVSGLLDDNRAQSLAAEPPPEGEADLPEAVSIRVPGFHLSIAGTDEDANGDNGSVSMSVGGEQNVIMRASEGGPGDADDTAFVRITGADEETARDFINDAEELSAETKSQMLSALGL